MTPLLLAGLLRAKMALPCAALSVIPLAGKERRCVTLDKLFTSVSLMTRRHFRATPDQAG